MAFHVADAPPHPGEAAAFLEEVDVARQQGIRLYPVAASGVEDSAEYLMRIAAQVTSARYVFLTDDSGIGSSHAEPHIPCYEVQLLGAVLARAIRSELTGHRLEASPAEIVRTVGNPERGICVVGEAELYL